MDWSIRNDVKTMISEKTVKIIIFLASVLISPVLSYSNDGFYQGSGSTMVPVHNKYLRVVSEDLKLSYIKEKQRGCYKVFYKGKSVKHMRSKAPSTAFATLKSVSGSCKEVDFNEGFAPKWKATAIYQVISSKKQTDVQMGFPIPLWEVYDESGGGVMIKAPSVVKFKTFINGKEVEKTEIKWLKGRFLSENKTLGYTWKASFDKGMYTLKTEYEFGEDDGDLVGFFEEVQRPWFGGGNIYGHGLSYFLTPLKFWASPPPKNIVIQVNMPENLYIPFVVPTGLKPFCLDKHSLFYKLENKFPGSDLKLHYPDPKWEAVDYEGEPPKIRSTENFNTWIKTLGGKQIKLTCGLLKELLGDAEDELAELLKKVNCVDSCKKEQGILGKQIPSIPEEVEFQGAVDE